jgi:hypothetical protein
MNTNIIYKLSNTKGTEFHLSAWTKENALSSGNVWNWTAAAILLALLPSEPW